MPRPMASDPREGAPPSAVDSPPDARTTLDQLLFVGFLLLVFVGLRPFAVPSPEVGVYGAQGMTGSGDLARQLCYLFAFAALGLAALRSRGPAVVLDMPVIVLLLLLWCLTSALWSPEPMVTVRRAGLGLVVAFCAFWSVQALPPARALSLWRWTLLAILLINIVSVHVITQAVHQPGEADAALVGNWRGLYGHKNIAGAVTAITALLFLFAPREKRIGKAFDICVAGLAVYFLIGTHSKSSLGLLAVAALFGLIYAVAWRRDIDRAIATVAALTVLSAGIVMMIADASLLTRIISDPTEFTGRTEIWKAEIAYFLDHPVFGAGFGSFADTGGTSPLAAYAPDWVANVSHGHNGYLQVMMTVGGIGLLLTLIGLLVQPGISFWRREGGSAQKPALFALFVFLVLHNLMESDFLESDGTQWVAHLLLLALLYAVARKAVP